MNYSILVVLGIVALVVFSGCIFATSIKDVKLDSYVGKEVTVAGTASGTVKIGDLSGYTVNDGTDSIAVSSLNLPKDGDTVRVTGTLRKIPIFGYYIEANN
jgi:uncharacterized membrane protein YdfJ with MMPL/SSD domain